MNTYLYIAIMALTTYAIRVLPLPLLFYTFQLAACSRSATKLQ